MRPSASDVCRGGTGEGRERSRMGRSGEDVSGVRIDVVILVGR